MSLLKVGNLCHHFGGLLALSDFSLDVQSGELLGLIGPNGAGKTTVFNMLTGVYTPSSGTIFFNGQNIVGLSPNKINRVGIARTFQNIRLFKRLSVIDNVLAVMYESSTYSPLHAILQGRKFNVREKRLLVNAEDLLARFNLVHLARQEAHNLPYGLQRKLEIVRALACRPKLLLLDEPAAGMNSREVEELVNLIQKVRQEFNLTIILIEHQMPFVMSLCERIVVLDFGAVIAEGLPEEIRGNKRVLESYLGAEVEQ